MEMSFHFALSEHRFVEWHADLFSVAFFSINGLLSPAPINVYRGGGSTDFFLYIMRGSDFTFPRNPQEKNV